MGQGQQPVRSGAARPDPGPVEFRADLARSRRLFAAFRLEQSDPEHFYGMLASDTVAQLRAYTRLDGATVVDVGGGAGYFSQALRAAGASVACLDVDAGEMSARTGTVPAGSVIGSAMSMPLRSASVDVCFSSNVLEHVPRPFVMATEMVRVTRPGGIIFLSFTNWLSPWGGHETSPWHYLGGHFAARRYLRRHGRGPKNAFGQSLFALSVGAAMRWAGQVPQADLIDARPRYLPSWAAPVVRVPLLREFATWNLVLVLRRR